MIGLRIGSVHLNMYRALAYVRGVFLVTDLTIFGDFIRNMKHIYARAENRILIVLNHYISQGGAIWL